MSETGNAMRMNGMAQKPDKKVEQKKRGGFLRENEEFIYSEPDNARRFIDISKEILSQCPPDLFKEKVAPFLVNHRNMEYGKNLGLDDILILIELEEATESGNQEKVQETYEKMKERKNLRFLLKPEDKK